MNWEEECRREHQLGLEKRAKMPYADCGIPFLLRPYMTPEKHADDLVLRGGLSDVARELLFFAVRAFRAGNLPAALIQSDARQLKMHEFCTYFGLPKDMSIEDSVEQTNRILRERFDGSIGNLPSEVWSDCIITVVKGPKILPFLVCTAYHGGTNGEVVFEETMENDTGEFNVLPDWWDTMIC
jgi:hypothetical protein